MPKLSFAERARLAMMMADRKRRQATASLLRSPLLRWRYGAPIADQLLIVPQDLRTADPSFWSEVTVGHFGLAGAVAFLHERSPFELAPPSEPWARDLHGFGWLRHLSAARSDEAKAAALAFVLDWIRHERSMVGTAWEPAVVGRRLISWISHAPLLLEGIDPKSYDLIGESLGSQMVHLSTAWRHAPAGHQRLLALTALVLADLCVAEHERQLAGFEPVFAAEIERQILADGGHVSRNPGTMIELLLDFLPLGQCFAARNRQLPKALPAAIDRMLPMVRFMRLGDGSLARFNGMGTPSPDLLATVLVYEGSVRSNLASAPASHYARIACGSTIIIADVGSPPPLDLAGEAHAGCLSFEMTDGPYPLLVNGGAPAGPDADWRSASRATASHNTLCLNNKSSSKLIRSRILEALVGSPPIRFPNTVVAKLVDREDGQELDARHDGYLKQFGLLHRRRLMLHKSGLRIDGSDRLGPEQGELRLSSDLPFAVHFHLHPTVHCVTGPDSNTATLTLPGGRQWLFRAQGATLGIEESVYFADFTGPSHALQIVLRAACFGMSEVRWWLSVPELASQPAPPPSSAGPPPLPKAANNAKPQE